MKMRSFISVYMSVFLKHGESLETVSSTEIAMLQRLNDVYIREAFVKRLKSDSKLSVQRCVSVY